MATTTNFGWTTPDDTALVKDGALAIRTLGQSIDTSFIDLKGGTTGQVLSKASNTDLDYTWVAGSASAVNKNYLINGGFAVAQRGTSFTAGANNDDAYTLDRWYILSDTNDVIDVTQETGTVPANSQFAIALDVETVAKKFGIATIIENKDLEGLIGETVTFSFKAKVSATTKLDNVKAAIVAWSGTADTVTSDIISAWNVEGTNPTLIANATYENTPANLSVTTNYATYSVSAALDTASLKNVILFVWSDVTDTTLGDFLYISQAKLEKGSTATAFISAGDTTQGELAACQRYYYRNTATANYSQLLNYAFAYNSSIPAANVQFMVPMRTTPSSIEFSNIAFERYDNTKYAVSAVLLGSGTPNGIWVYGTASGLTANDVGRWVSNNTTSAYFAFNAEL
jgi:hypothetical protein